MKKAAAIAIVLVLALCGCEGNGIERGDAESKASPSVGDRFLCDDARYEFETVVDSRTGVTYLVWKTDSSSSSYGRVGGITPLLNRDGSLVISEEVGK